MQTFLPYADFAESARALDYRRLGKQRVEAMQLIRAIQSGGGWSRHPAAIMWRDHVPALQQYHDACVREWVARGYRNTMRLYEQPNAVMPSWLGDPAFHASHRSNLLRKDPQHYGQFGWQEPADLPYVWPLAQQAGAP